MDVKLNWKRRADATLSKATKALMICKHLARKSCGYSFHLPSYAQMISLKSSNSEVQHLTGRQGILEYTCIWKETPGVHWYTDDLKTAEGIGTGIYGPRTKRSVLMSSFPSNFQTEVYGICHGRRDTNELPFSATARRHTRPVSHRSSSVVRNWICWERTIASG